MTFGYAGGRAIPNCHLDLYAYHQATIALPPTKLAELRTKRNIVRAMIKRRLAAMDWYQPIGFRGQGSVAMGTVIREQWYSSYDIDDGIYFSTKSLTGPRGGMLSGREARSLIYEAAYDERYSDPPEMRKNCVRIYYSKGFHIDVPVYRKTLLGFAPPRVELASTEWRPSDPQAVTQWFRDAAALSPGIFTNRQLTRIVRYMKAWSGSRAEWPERMLGGFGITKLVVDHYRPHPNRDDRALLETLWAIFRALDRSTTIWHPVIQGEQVCHPDRQAPVRFLRDCLGFYLERLEGVRSAHSRAEALRYWGAFFLTEYFSNRRRIWI